ncbi:hypothetical protein GBA63_21670 (plasmid) [Rubrobacter tropicus]|uniref:Uncharacterized protein n=1 Tax=Rubrobacter tropicus TaxID=2653851 RepID=A0A6G8QFT7_9ACTN|nr:hypothetical protein [Rubrobacter tropicus]QIN85330.1 hypothetical protein GBA63_21670 [Rubrobacter tropicus]
MILLDTMLMLLQAGDAWDRGGSSRQDVWGPIITWLRAIVLSAAGLGMILGVVHKLIGDDDSDRETFWNRIIGASVTGLLVGLLAEPFVDVMRVAFGM